MSFIINDSTKVVNIQEAFCALFPYLKVEFYKKGAVVNSNAVELKQPILVKDRTLAEIAHFEGHRDMVISPDLKVGELEHDFHEMFGIYVQVFRKSGNVWLLTTFTDSWTLEEQNHQGQIITQQVNDRKNKAS